MTRLWPSQTKPANTAGVNASWLYTHLKLLEFCQVLRREEVRAGGEGLLVERRFAVSKKLVAKSSRAVARARRDQGESVCRQISITCPSFTKAGPRRVRQSLSSRARCFAFFSTSPAWTSRRIETAKIPCGQIPSIVRSEAVIRYGWRENRTKRNLAKHQVPSDRDAALHEIERSFTNFLDKVLGAVRRDGRASACEENKKPRVGQSLNNDAPERCRRRVLGLRTRQAPASCNSPRVDALSCSGENGSCFAEPSSRPLVPTL